MPGRRWSEGLHQAIEAKEGLRVQRESVTLATITFQNYFRLYDKLSGMTGTAMTEQEEFYKIYGLEVVVDPDPPADGPRGRRRTSSSATEDDKFDALIDEIVEMTEAGRPVLVGTTSVEKSEVLSEMLKRRGIKHEVLNAKFHEKEAPIVAQAGRSGAVTIATNMAGRGTDILLGGNPAGMASTELHRAGHQPGRGAAGGLRGGPREGQGATSRRTTSEVVAAGGLHIIGTERHEARRIDNQLRGRAGRQGDPGSSRFYLSLEDTLMKRFASDRVAGPDGAHGPRGRRGASSRGSCRKTIENAQTRVEGYNFDIRKRVVEYDDVINKQRETIYAERDKVLSNEDLTETVRELRRRRDRGARRRPPGRRRRGLGLRRPGARDRPDGPRRRGPRRRRPGRARRPRGGRSSTCARRSTTTLEEREQQLRRGGLGAGRAARPAAHDRPRCGSTT